MGREVITVSGNRLSLDFSPPEYRLDIKDIAHGLSMQCRYNGQIRWFYNVADHCVAVANAVYKITRCKNTALEGLLHDAHEAFVGDVSQPVKAHMMDEDNSSFHNLERYMAGAVMVAFGVPTAAVKDDKGWLYKPSEAVTDMDQAAYRHESYCLRRPSTDNMKFVELFDDLEPSDIEKSRKSYLDTFRRLSSASRKH